VLFKYVMVRLY